MIKCAASFPHPTTCPSPFSRIQPSSVTFSPYMIDISPLDSLQSIPLTSSDATGVPTSAPKESRDSSLCTQARFMTQLSRGDSGPDHIRIYLFRLAFLHRSRPRFISLRPL
ncbi:hypothetical protein Zmor_012987 [Zophobas morio]|uniref:Uncharacterized protein n=1 Tax=Zophobas morio TaxID=2755281 RepID=A0AA38ME73_9CUCU|nr:hypothetical protein Zmor_012987 [Zophobas morio]